MTIASKAVNAAEVQIAQAADPSGITAVTPGDIRQMAARMRGCAPLAPMHVAKILAAVVEAWRDHTFSPRRATICAIAAAWGYSEPLLEASFDALLAPFTEDALADFASALAVAHKDEVSGPIRCNPAGRIIGMVMPGNLPGAGLHEVLIGLISGRALILKTSLSEPLFFASFARSIAQFDSWIGTHIAVFNWSRERHDLTAAMRANCDQFVAYGDDDTLSHLENAARVNEPAKGNTVGASGPLDTGFGERYSGVYLTAELIDDTAASRAAAAAIARDITLFEQAGCLSPHHIFVDEGCSEDVRKEPSKERRGRAYQFAGELAAALESLAVILPPPVRLGLESAANLRRVREAARWRMIGGEAITLWEGTSLSWTVVCDESASFTPSPGMRTVTVSPVRSLPDLAERLRPVTGRVEAFALAGSGRKLMEAEVCLKRLGVSYLCPPGMMQSPPLQWRHGGGAFLDAMLQPVR